MTDDADVKIIGYRDLTPDEKYNLNAVKEAYNAVGAVLEKLSRIPGYDQRALAIAKTDTQTAAMWACRAITKPTTFA